MYIYNGNEGSVDVDVEFDNEGMLPIPIDGSTMKRRGRYWSVVKTVFEGVNTKPKGLPLLKIYLTDQLTDAL